jgi:hypothetical protein
MASLQHLLESIRQKPKHVRSQYAFWVSLFVTVCIALVWGFSLKAKYAPEVAAEEPLTETDSSFMNELGEVVGSMRSIPALFKGTVEYAKEPQAPVAVSKTLDLDVLVASSTRAERMRQRNASTTPSIAE